MSGAVEELLASAERTAGPGAFVTSAVDRALAEAHEEDRSSPCGPLHRLPPAVKDNIHAVGPHGGFQSREPPGAVVPGVTEATFS